MAFADKLKELLNKNELKAADLARYSGLSEAAISDYLKGKKEPRGRQSIVIAKALNVSLDELWETGYNNTKSNENASLLDIEISTLYASLNDENKKYLYGYIQRLLEEQKEK